MKACAIPILSNFLLRILRIAVLTHGAHGRRTEAPNNILDVHDEAKNVRHNITEMQSGEDTRHGLVDTMPSRHGLINTMPSRLNATGVWAKNGTRYGHAQTVPNKWDANDTQLEEDTINRVATAAHAMRNATETPSRKNGHAESVRIQQSSVKARSTASEIRTERIHDNRSIGVALVEVSEWTQAARLAVFAWAQRSSAEAAGILIACLLVVAICGAIARQLLQRSDSSSSMTTRTSLRTPRSSSKPLDRSPLPSPRGRRRSLAEIRAITTEQPHPTYPETDIQPHRTYPETDIHRMRKAHTEAISDGTQSLPVGRTVSEYVTY